MEVRKVNSVSSFKPAFKNNSVNYSGRVSFKANPASGGANASKKVWFYLRRLADEMKDITEIKNALIAAVGTGIIAPAIILVSPGKGDKEDKDKKFIQALRQPLSAGLSLGAQVPATMLINYEIDKLGYEKKIKMFKDDTIGELIPTEKFLKKGIKKEEYKAWEAKFNNEVEGKALREELEAKIKKDYKEVGLEISDEKLAERVKKEKKNFLRQKIAQDKFEKLKKDKVKDILDHPDKYPKLADIKDIDLVTEEYQDLAKLRFKDEYNQLEKDAKLSGFDKTMREMGFETKKTKALEDAQKDFKKKRGLELLKQEKPEIFENRIQRVKKFVDAYQKESEKVFSNKKFWFSLLVNLFMVTVSCYALNWIHPRVNKMIENKKAEKEAAKNPKVEVA